MILQIKSCWEQNELYTIRNFAIDLDEMADKYALSRALKEMQADKCDAIR